MQYTKKVMKHFMKPKHVGEIKNADGIGTAGNPRCGDLMTVYIKVKNNKIINAKFKTLGCVAAIASSDALCELVIGKTVKDAKKITAKEIADYLGELPKIKFHCSILGREALTKAINNYLGKQKS